MNNQLNSNPQCRNPKLKFNLLLERITKKQCKRLPKLMNIFQNFEYKYILIWISIKLIQRALVRDYTFIHSFLQLDFGGLWMVNLRNFIEY